MKASELIQKLNEAIEAHGDKEIYRLGTVRYEPASCVLYTKEGKKDPKYAFLHEPDDYFKIL